MRPEKRRWGAVGCVESFTASPKCPSAACPGRLSTYSPAPSSFTIDSDRSGNCAGAACWRLTDRKSTRLNSSHLVISYAVFCLKKKKRCTGKQECHEGRIMNVPHPTLHLLAHDR